MTSSELQLVHLSDLHIGLASGTGEGSWGTVVERLRKARQGIPGLEEADADNLKRLAESAARDKIAKRLGGQVHCIASGDLTAQGGKREFGRAFRYLRKTLSTPKAGLAYGAAGGYSHVLGNHDVWRSDLDRATRKGFRRTTEVREIVRKRGEAHSPRGLGDPYHVDLGPLRVRVYLLESWRLNLGNVFASGHVSSNQLKELKHTVEADKKSDGEAGIRACLRIAVLHHPVKPKPKGWLGWLPFVFHPEPVNLCETGQPGNC